MDEEGSVATLAVFTVFVLMLSIVALHTFEAGFKNQQLTFTRAIAMDTTKAVATTIQGELNEALRDSIQAAMYEWGKKGGSKSQVQNRIIDYFNQRISAGWDYSNFREIYVPLADENSIDIRWLPDGSLAVLGYLEAEFVHVAGIKAYGVYVNAGVVPRYGRLYETAHLALQMAREAENLEEFEMEINENFACEMLRFTIGSGERGPTVTVVDRYGGRVIAKD
ncbi:MAG: hypothetical protein ACK4GQ_04875 [Candidatus Hadarchaeales archaeon]